MVAGLLTLVACQSAGGERIEPRFSVGDRIVYEVEAVSASENDNVTLRLGFVAHVVETGTSSLLDCKVGKVGVVLNGAVLPDQWTPNQTIRLAKNRLPSALDTGGLGYLFGVALVALAAPEAAPERGAKYIVDLKEGSSSILGTGKFLGSEVLRGASCLTYETEIDFAANSETPKVSIRGKGWYDTVAGLATKSTGVLTYVEERKGKKRDIDVRYTASARRL